MKTRSGLRLNRYRARPRAVDVALAAYNTYRDLRTRYRSRGTQTRTSGRQKYTTSGKGVTTQHDRRLIYRKRRMPRRKRKAWKAFVNKVHAVDEKDLGTRSVLFNRQVTTTNDSTAATDQQSVLTISLYGNQAGTELHNNDLQYISNLENPVSVAPDNTATGGYRAPTVYPSTKFLFKSAVLDLTIRNVSTEVTSLTPLTTPISSLGKIEMDIYEISISKDMYDNTPGGVGSYSSIEGMMANMNTQDINLVIPDQNITGEVRITPSSRGFTPFDATYALSKYGIKIWKKTKFFIPAGDTITYQIRDPKRHVINYESLSSVLGFNRKGVSKFLLCVSKFVPGVQQGPVTAVGNLQLRIAYGITRKYVYKVEGINDDRNEYIAQT